MSSDAQVVANIENARHSTGPRTEEGKARSSQNALKHGLTSNKSLLLPDEDEEKFRESPPPPRRKSGLKGPQKHQPHRQSPKARILRHPQGTHADPGRTRQDPRTVP